MSDQDKRGFALRDVPAWWPIIAAAFAGLALAAQAYAQIADHDRRISDLEKAQPAIARELAAVNIGIARLEGKIDTINERDKARLN